LTDKDTDGVDLRFGNSEAMVQMTEKIGRREGLGDMLAEGSARAAQRIGRGAEDLVVAVKNLEFACHMPQLKRSLGLIYSVNPFGADHRSSEHDTSYLRYPDRLAELDLNDPRPSETLDKEKVRFALTTQYFYSCLDSINMCGFVFGPGWQLYGSGELVDAARLVTGWALTLQELLRVGERRLNMLRVFNAREGVGRFADTLPKKLFKPLRGGKTDGVYISEEEMNRARDTYYVMAGWDPVTGMPTRAKLEELDLGWLTDALEE
jgi:aldehyde:ferredoxin oxidoreductase